MCPVSAFRYVSIEALVPAVLLGLLAAAAVSVPAVRRGEPAAAILSAARALLAGAVVAVLAVTLIGGAGGTGLNMMPGAGIRSALNNVNHRLGLLNLLGNVIMFAPVGFLVPFASRHRWSGATAACVVLSATIEVTQLLTGRSFDIDDILLNALGGALGAGLGIPLSQVLRRRVCGPSGTVDEATAH